MPWARNCRPPARRIRAPRDGGTPVSARGVAGFSLLEVLLASVVVLIAATVGVMHVTRSAQGVVYYGETAFARQRALSILNELRAHVQRDQDRCAADLDDLSDGTSASPVLTLARDPLAPLQYVAPDHVISGNVHEHGTWAWWRRIEVRPLGAEAARDLRLVTVRVYRARPGRPAPGERMAEISTVIRTVGRAYPSTQVYDVYLLALENVPGWWVSLDAIRPFMQAALQDIEARNPGLQFRAHWVTRLGYGRDAEYAPYVNDVRTSTDATPWAYVYPGRMPAGQATLHYYVPTRFGGRINVDGTSTPAFVNEWAYPEPYADTNDNGRYDEGEPFTDADDDGVRHPGNLVPYALADMHNHCLRWPDEQALFDARVAAGTEEADTPTWRLLLDEMIAHPDRFHNAILVNLHGDLLPVPPARNYSDAAKDPELRPGWRVVTHPERLRPARVAGSDTATQAPRFRVYAWKAQPTEGEVLTTPTEPYVDANRNGRWDTGEAFTDWNQSGAWDAGLPITVVIRDGNFAGNPNGATSPSIVVERLSGGVDADGDGTADAYADWAKAPAYPESFADTNGNGRREVAETWLDLNGNGTWDSFEPWTEVDGNGVYTPSSETLVDQNGDDDWDPACPEEPYIDADADGKWDAAEPYWDKDGNNAWTAPTSPSVPWVAWSPASYGDTTQTLKYILRYGEPFLDVDGSTTWTAAETFTDLNGNGVRDGGVRRGEMWFEVRWEASPPRTVLALHGTPLETPYLSETQRGLPGTERLYDLDYVPCPTPSSSTGPDRFDRSLYTTGSEIPKNTARWTIELPPAAVRKGFESQPGANDGDAADRVIAVETRLGNDLETGTMWPTRHKPADRSVSYAYFHASPATVPYSERFQFLGDPRHSPYADTDRQGTTAENGYNWYFDDLSDSSVNAQGNWLAFDPARLLDLWNEQGGGHDVPRLLAWVREALTSSAAVYTTLTGCSYRYLSLGGDVGADASNGYPNSIPMDGTPFGLTGAVNENTLTDGEGTSTLRGSLKYVRGNTGAAAAIRSGGYWWSKPWIGEIWDDATYATQWAPWGNLRAGAGSAAGTYRLVSRGDITTTQQPPGTTLIDACDRLGDEGCTCFFHIGASSSTFHHQVANGTDGGLVDDGMQLTQNYGLTLPTRVPISRPFGLATNSAGSVGPEFPFTDTYPRGAAQLVHRFYDHVSGQTGSGLVRLQRPGTNPTAAYLVVNGLDRTTGSGSAFLSRYAMVSLIHGFLAAGAPGLANRVAQVPQVFLTYPTLTTELLDPASIPVRWERQWKRWDGRAYTAAYPSTFTEPSSDLRYVLLYSSDGGTNWRNALDDSAAEPGRLPWVVGTGPDPARTLPTRSADGHESWTWPLPPDRFPDGPYLLRVEAYRAAEPLHYAWHQERFHVDR